MDETDTDKSEPAGTSSHLVLWFGGYLVAAAVGHLISAFVVSPLPLSLSAGVALAAALSLGVRAWPAIAGAAFLSLIFTARGADAGLLALVLACAGGAAGITVGATTAAGIVHRLAGKLPPFSTVTDYLVFVGFGAILSGLIAGSAVAACFGLAGLSDHYVGMWRGWFSADLLGAMVVTPMLLAWVQSDDGAVYQDRKAEVAVLALTIVLCSLVAMGPLAEFVGPVASHPLILVLPLAWAVLRFGLKGSTVCVLLVSLLAIWGTGAGFGAFNAASVEYPLPALQFMILIITATTFVIGSLTASQHSTEHELIEANRRLGVRVDERTEALRESEERLGNLTTTDDLTGASNRGYFLEMSKMEFYRARR